jgi:hypothetical protein
MRSVKKANKRVRKILRYTKEVFTMTTFSREEQIDVLEQCMRQERKRANANRRLLEWVSGQVERRKQNLPSPERDTDLEAFDALRWLVEREINRSIESIDRDVEILKEMEREKVHGET